jgi:HupE/UreJ protein
MRRGVLAALLALLVAMPAYAHVRSESFSVWRIDAHGRVHATFRASARDATALQNLNPRETVPLTVLFARHLTTHVFVQRDGVDCKPLGPAQAIASDPTQVAAELEFDCGGAAVNAYSLDLHLFFEVLAQHVHFARVTTPLSSADFVATPANGRLTIAAAAAQPAPDLLAAFGTYVQIGIEHIAEGADHIAFIIGLLLCCASFRVAAMALTGFTLGHSLTLGLAATGLVSPQVQAIEAMIGFTIVLMAFEAFQRASRQASAAWVAPAVTTGFAGAALIGSAVLSPFALGGAVAISGAQAMASRTSTVFLIVSTALFGLIHGFGFANALIEVGLPPGRLIAGLAGFNIGVEIGQIFIAGALWLLAGLALRHPRVAAEAQGLRQAAALALIALGTFWLVSRTF